MAVCAFLLSLPLPPKESSPARRGSCPKRVEPLPPYACTYHLKGPGSHELTWPPHHILTRWGQIQRHDCLSVLAGAAKFRGRSHPRYPPMSRCQVIGSCLGTSLCGVSTSQHGAVMGGVGQGELDSSCLGEDTCQRRVSCGSGSAQTCTAAHTHVNTLTSPPWSSPLTETLPTAPGLATDCLKLALPL